jgi:hypothetical protein
MWQERDRVVSSGDDEDGAEAEAHNVTDHAGRLIVYDHEIHLGPYRTLAAGGAVQVIRGNGPREGDRVGTATITSFEDGSPILHVRLGDEQSGEVS